MKNVLIFGGGSYAASQNYNALKDTVRFHPILASSNDNHSVFISQDAIINLPYDSKPEFVSEIKKCVAEHNIDFIIPSHDTAAVILKENEENIGATVVCSPIKTTRICRSKKETYAALEKYDFVPKTYSRGNLSFPVFAKDDVGQGGKNCFYLQSFKDMDKLNEDSDYVFCEFLPGQEITVDCFTDRFGKLRFVQPRVRERLLNGISARARNIELTDEVKHIVEEINNVLEFRSYWFVQCKEDKNGKLKLMEISTRFAGTFGLSKNLDVNLPLLALQDFSNVDISIIPNTYEIVLDKSYIDRYKVNYDYQRVYIDFDDTLVFNRKKYNTEAIRFLFQCLNNKKEIVLITKHLHNIRETMEAIRLWPAIFDKIIEVPLNEPKYCFIDVDVKSIFIDNAFAERKLVKEKLNIPTFDVTNIECLIDWSE